jgi:chaperone modulatory protein CbpM
MPQTITAICRAIPGLTETTLLAFIAEDWVRPETRHGETLFSEADAARVRLILDLRATMEVDAGTLPIVLSLLDQLYATRRQLRLVLEVAGPDITDRVLQAS